LLIENRRCDDRQTLTRAVAAAPAILMSSSSIDLSYPSTQFKVRQLKIAYVQAEFRVVRGSYSSGIRDSNATAEVNAAAINTRNEQRGCTFQAADLSDVRPFPVF